MCNCVRSSYLLIYTYIYIYKSNHYFCPNSALKLRYMCKRAISARHTISNYSTDVFLFTKYIDSFILIKFTLKNMKMRFVCRRWWWRRWRWLHMYVCNAIIYVQISGLALNGSLWSHHGNLCMRKKIRAYCMRYSQDLVLFEIQSSCDLNRFSLQWV